MAMHILLRNRQFGYKESISAIDAIVKVEQYIEHGRRDAVILPMSPTNASDAINRTLLWTTLYKKGIREETINNSRRGHQGARLAPKYKVNYGKTVENNIGVFRGSSIGAILFIIYMGEAMEDSDATQRRLNLPYRKVKGRPTKQTEEMIR